MRNFDLAPLYRATVGFDQIADLMDRVFANDVGQSTYPPYNIEKTDENAYRISIAVAGFSANDLSVELRENALIVSARKPQDTEGPRRDETAVCASSVDHELVRRRGTARSDAFESLVSVEAPRPSLGHGGGLEQDLLDCVVRGSTLSGAARDQGRRDRKAWYRAP